MVRTGISLRFSWCPSGHGSIYESIYHTGMLERLISKGKKYIFISNIDNLGATIDSRILYSCLPIAVAIYLGAVGV